MLPGEQSTTTILSCSSFVNHFYRIHYFLWFSSLSGVLPYYVVFVRTYTSASASWIGTLFSLLPFVAFFTNPFFCSLADKSSNHLKYLLIFIGLTCTGYGLLLIIPTVDSPLVSWSLSMVLLLIAYPSMATVTSLTDSIVMMMVTSSSGDVNLGSKSSRLTFGQVRVWGTIGYGFFGFISGPINSINFDQSYLQLGFYMFIIICFVDFLIVAIVLIIIYKRKQNLSSNLNCPDKSEGQHDDRMLKITNDKFKSRKNYQQEILTLVNHDNQVNNYCHVNQLVNGQSTNHWKSFASLFINHPTIIQHAIILIGQGILMSCHWSFFYWYLETISGPDTILMGLTLLIGCFCGELTFFYFGNLIVDQIGPSNSFNISLIAFAIQYFSYAFLIVPGNQYLVCFTEILQGPTFGLFYTAMTHIGQEYADKQLTSETDRLKSNCPKVSQLSTDDENNSIKFNGGHQDDQGKIKIHSTLQGFLSGCLEGLGLGLGSLGAGLIIDHYDVKTMWISAGSLSIILLTFNLSLQLIDKLFTKR